MTFLKTPSDENSATQPVAGSNNNNRNDSGTTSLDASVITRRARLKQSGAVVFTILTILAAAAAGYFTLILASSTEFTVGPVHAQFALTPAWTGKSIVDLPPAGTIEADTHTGPAVVEYTLKEIAVSNASELTDPGSPSRQALQNWQEPVDSQIRSIVLRTLLISALAGGVVALLMKRRWQWGLGGAAIALAVTVLVAGTVWQTYDTAAFREPHYTGSLTYAPEVVTFSEETLANLDKYEDRVPEIAASLYNTISQLHQLPAALPQDDVITVLHVSDMHSSQAAANLVKQTLDLYKADFVIDTGDLTDMGTPFEAKYASTYLPLAKPYVWVAGNHDSPDTASAMRAIDGVVVLEDQFRDVGGIRVGGFPDPASLSSNPAPSSDQVQSEEARRILRLVNDEKFKPFIVAVHDPKQAALMAGQVPVVVDGHTHEEDVSVRDGTVYLDAGSTGGGGFRGFNGNRESPSSLQVLYIQKDPLKLVAVDSISIFGFSQEFSVTRHVFAADEGRFGPVQASLPFAEPVLR